MKKINIAFGIHNHQPVGNFDFVFEDAYNKAYLPFLALLEKYPQIKMAQHYTGILFEWIKDHKPEFIPRLRKLVDAGQVEMMTGGYYEPIMSVIPYRDKIGQIQKLTRFVKEQTGYDAKGMWLAERIWEPQLPKPCHEAGVKYLVLDDSHFKNAGLEDEELLGYYVTEDEGKSVYLFPIYEKLRYTIPFEPPENTIKLLRTLATEDEQRLIVFADDGEKFGIWPNTYTHCYENGWLEKFFKALQDNADWINIVHLSEALEMIEPLGRIYLPTASYREMMEWAMPTHAIHQYENFETTLKEHKLLDRYKVFVRGGFWRNFMVKYPESNNMHKRMLLISHRLERMAKDFGHTEVFRQAQDHLWAGQCNCPYWHGVFGGLYLNHLRYATYHEFIQAEQLLDQLDYKNTKSWAHTEVADMDADSFDEVLFSTPEFFLQFSPENGGALVELDYKPGTINLLDTMTRREEGYHKKLLNKGNEPKKEPGKNGNEENIPSIHDLVVVKEEGLEKLLHYDWYRRTSMLDHFLHENTTLGSFSQCKYKEQGDFVNASYHFKLFEGKNKLMLWREGHVWVGNDWAPILLTKTISLTPGQAALHVEYAIKNLDSAKRKFWFGSEWDFALLAGDASDRYYFFPGKQIDDRQLRSLGEVNDASEAQLIDEWLIIGISLKVEPGATFWRFPIETISQSESGFERVYQSSVIMPHWRFGLAPGESWQMRLKLEIK